MIEKANIKDLDALDELAILVINHMKDSNIPQWTLAYPRKEHFMQDIEQDALILYKEGNRILACMAILPDNDPAYRTISSWKKEHSIVIHRILVHPSMEASGIGSALMNYAIRYGINEKFESIKIDTHLENYKMRGFLEKKGFLVGDYIEVMDRIAYELLLEDNL